MHLCYGVFISASCFFLAPNLFILVLNLNTNVASEPTQNEVIEMRWIDCLGTAESYSLGVYCILFI